jgi:nucleoside-diphosphate-sugar epimerase
MLSHLLAEPRPPQRVVVLGSAGFIGRGVAAAASGKGWTCLALSRKDVDLADPGAAETLRPLLKPGDSLVVAAALTPDRGRDVATLMTNLRMAEALSKVLGDAACAQVVYLSSDAVYDGAQPLISEGVAPSPTDLYSLMHVARERILAHAAGASGIPYCVLRPSAVMGPGDTHNSYGPNRFIRSALKDRRIKLFGGGEEMRDHAFVEDVVALVTLVLEHRSAGVLNAASGQSVSFHELAGQIAALVGGGVELENLPRSGPITHRHFDTTNRTRAFPRFRPTRLEEALERTVAGLRLG